MCFDIADRRRAEVGLLQRLANDRLLRGTARHRQPAAGAIVVDHRAANKGQNRITVGLGIGKPFEHDNATTFPAYVTIRRSVKRLAAPIGGQHARLGKGNGILRAKDQPHAAGQRQITFMLPQTLTGLMERHQ